MSKKPRLFLSHIHEEAALAGVLKKWTEKSFLGQCDVFVSSDKDSIPAGSRWFEKIGEALAESRIFVVLCSPESLRRPWINFETGYGFAKGVEVLPVCHSGQKKGELPRTLSEFTAVEIGDENFCADYLWGIAKPLGYSETPDIDDKKVMAELTGALSQIRKKQETAKPQPKTVVEEAKRDIPEGCKKILRFMKSGYVQGEYMPSFCIPAALPGTPSGAVWAFVGILKERGLIENAGGYYYLTPKGDKWSRRDKWLG